MRNIIVKCLATATAATAIAIGGSTTALAGARKCDIGEFCLYENTNFNTGSFNTYGLRQWRGNDANYSNDRWWDYRIPRHHNVDVLNDEVSSLRNRTSCRVVLAEHANGAGDTSTFLPGEWVTSLSGERVGDNRASSHQKIC